MADVPIGGVPRSVFESTELGRQLLPNIEFWANQYGLNPQHMMDIIWRESGAGNIANGTAYIQLQAPTHGRGVYGPAGLKNDTYPGVGVTNPHDPGQAAMGLAIIMNTYGRGGNIGPNGPQGMFLPYDPLRMGVFYNGGPTLGRRWEESGRNNNILNSETRNYIEHTTRGIGIEYNQSNINRAWANTPEVAQLWRQHDQDLGLVGPLGQVRTDAPMWGQNPVGDFWRLQQGPPGMLGQPPPWERAGIINPEYGHYLQTQGLMPSNLVPTAGTDFTNTTWNAPAGSQPGWWGPWGAEAVHNWAQEGVSHGYGQPLMGLLANLNYNLVDPGLPAGPGNAPLGGTPAPIGPTTGLPGTATGGVDLAHWVAQQWGTGWGNRGLDRGLDIWDATPGVRVQNRPFSDSPNVWDASGVAQRWEGQPADLTFWDATRPSNVHVIDQPSGTGGPGPGIQVWSGDVSNWVPTTGTWGTPGAVSPYQGWEQNQNMFYNPGTRNWGSVAPGVNPNPDLGTWRPEEGYSGPNYQDYFATAGLPSGGFGAVQPSGGSTLADSYHSALFPNMYYNTIFANQMTDAQNQLQQQMAAQAAAAQQQLAQQNQQLNQTLINQVNRQPTPWGQTPGTVSTGLELY